LGAVEVVEVPMVRLASGVTFTVEVPPWPSVMVT
jgi:hypothetical protein